MFRILSSRSQLRKLCFSVNSRKGDSVDVYKQMYATVLKSSQNLPDSDCPSSASIVTVCLNNSQVLQKIREMATQPQQQDSQWKL